MCFGTLQCFTFVMISWPLHHARVGVVQMSCAGRSSCTASNGSAAQHTTCSVPVGHVTLYQSESLMVQAPVHFHCRVLSLVTNATIAVATSKLRAASDLTLK
jgi:hypothetical protein